MYGVRRKAAPLDEERTVSAVYLITSICTYCLLSPHTGAFNLI